MNKNGMILAAVVVVIIVVAAAAYVVLSDKDGDSGNGDGLYEVGGSIGVQVHYTNDLGGNQMTYPEYTVTGYENGEAIVEEGLHNTTYRITDGGLVSLAFPLVDYMFGMTVVGTEIVTIPIGEYSCEVWTAGEGDDYCAVFVDIDTGNVVKTIQNGTIGGVGYTEERTLYISEYPIDPFVMTNEMEIRSGLGVGDYVTYTTESTEDDASETHDTTYTVTAVDGFLVEYTISGEDSVITDTLDVRVFIDMFCPDETQNMIADRTETISTPFGDAECTVLSNMHQGYGAEQWVSMDTGFLYKSETNRPDGIASISVLKDTSLI